MARVVRTLREKRARLQEIEREARRLRADLQAIRDAAGAAGTDRRGGRRPPRKRRGPISVRPGSSLGRALAALRASKRPLRIERILRVIERKSGRKLRRSTVESQLSRYAQKGHLVRRTGPAEFALIGERGSSAKARVSRRRRGRKRR